MNLKKYLISICLIINILNAYSQIVDSDFKNNQPKENSPLSRLGLGNIASQYLAGNSGSGGLSAAYRDPYSYNPFNPASLPSLRATAFEVGLNIKNNNISDGTNKTSAWSGGLNYVAIGFPTYSVINEVLDRKPRKFRWAMGLSLMPYNAVGYSVGTTEKSPGTDTISITNLYYGSGGTYRIMLGNGVSYKGFSIGANIGYVFGKMNYIRQSEYTNVTVPYNNYFDDNYTLKGLTWNAGVQYTITLDPTDKPGERGNRKHIVIGAYGNPSSSFDTKLSYYYRRNAGSSLLTDTIAFAEGQAGKGKLPSEFTMGVSYENGLKLRVGAEYKIGKWSQYENDARPNEQLKDVSRFAFGAEFILNKSPLKTEEEKVRWRIGYFNGKDPRVLNGEQLTNSAATLGMCLPLRVGRGQQISYLNLGLEYGKLGTPKLSENYLRLNVGFTLNDNSWFLKRKFQ
jgi:hypothetical protein